MTVFISQTRFQNHLPNKWAINSRSVLLREAAGNFSPSLKSHSPTNHSLRLCHHLPIDSCHGHPKDKLPGLGEGNSYLFEASETGLWHKGRQCLLVLFAVWYQWNIGRGLFWDRCSQISYSFPMSPPHCQLVSGAGLKLWWSSHLTNKLHFPVFALSFTFALSFLTW